MDRSRIYSDSTVGRFARQYVALQGFCLIFFAALAHSQSHKFESNK